MELRREGCFGDAVALIEGDRVVTYRELDALVAALCDRLGTTRRLVSVRAANTVDTVVAYLAALRGGHVAALTAADDARAHDAFVARYDPDVVIAGTEVQPRREGSAHVLHRDLALLLSTSGSTGTPKFVRLSHDNLASNAAAIASFLALTPRDRAITTLPMQYCYGLSVLNSHLLSGASVVLAELSVLDACFWELARAHDVTNFAGVPHTFELLERIGFSGAELPTLRYVTQAGGRMAPERVERFAALGATAGFELFVMYGQTEATARMAYLPPELAPAHPGAIGVAIPGGELRVNRPGRDGVGELVYRGPNVMLGYAAGPRDLAAGRTVDELRTGDLGRRTADGLFEVVGRTSRFVKPFGVRVDLDDLERSLAEDGHVATCTGDDSRLVVATVRGASNTVRAAVEARVRVPYAHLDVLELEVPRLANGKADHAVLHALAGNDTPAAMTVRDVFRVVLGAEPSADDSFASLGGDSLSHVEASILLEDHLGELPRDWHRKPVGALEALATTHHRRGWARVDTTVVMRAVAIVLIVGNHTRLWQQSGGAHSLLAVAGFNFARFQLNARKIFQSAQRIAVPSMVIIGAIAAVGDKFGVTHALLVNDVLGHNDVWSFWFVEALVQTLIVLGLAFAIPQVARFERRRPMLTAYIAIAAGLAVRFNLVEPTTNHWVWWPHDVFFLFALGWAAARANTHAHRAAVSLLVAATVPGFFTNELRGVIVIAAVIALAWLPTLAVPRVAMPLVAQLAGASLYIYLTHIALYPVLFRTVGSLGAALGSLALGIVTWRVARRVKALWSARHHRGASVVKPLLWRPQFGRGARAAESDSLLMS